mgnify:CR=1 FL=1
MQSSNNNSTGNGGTRIRVRVSHLLYGRYALYHVPCTNVLILEPLGPAATYLTLPLSVALTTRALLCLPPSQPITILRSQRVKARLCSRSYDASGTLSHPLPWPVRSPFPSGRLHAAACSVRLMLLTVAK